MTNDVDGVVLRDLKFLVFGFIYPNHFVFLIDKAFP